MATKTPRGHLLRFGTTAIAYAAGAAIVTSCIALASQTQNAATTSAANHPQKGR